MKHKVNKKIIKNDGFTLVEALIAIIILAIVSVLMVQGVKMTRIAYSSNKIKTEASALANREIEKIRSMGFDNAAAGSVQLPPDANGFTISRTISILPGSNGRIKQIKVIVSNPSLINSIKVVTEITPVGMTVAGASTTSSSTTSTTSPATTTTSPATTTTSPATTTTSPATTTTTPATTTTTILHPAPYNLVVVSDKITAKNRIVILQWKKPLNTSGDIKYNVYRNDILINTFDSSVLIIQYTNDNLSKKDLTLYRYHIKAVYDGIESLPSNEVSTSPQ